MSAARDKGTRMESLVREGLREAFGTRDIERSPLHGRADEGDIIGLKVRGERVVVEVKNVKRFDLAGWVTEAEIERGNADAIAGFVIAKRPRFTAFGDQYAIGTVRDWLALGWGVTS